MHVMSEPAAPHDEREHTEPADTARFEDPYWDDAFCAWWDPTLRVCC